MGGAHPTQIDLAPLIRQLLAEYPYQLKFVVDSPDDCREVDAYLASLDPSVVERIQSAGFPRLIERHRHRTDHGDAIARTLSSGV